MYCIEGKTFYPRFMGGLFIALALLLCCNGMVWASCVNPAPLNKPSALSFDKHGYLYVANTGANQVLVFTVQRTNFNMVGGGGITQVNCITQGLNQPTGLAFDSSWNLFVSNLGSNSVTVYAANGNPLTTAFAQITNQTMVSGIASPLGVAVDSQENVYVANNSTNSIAEFVHQSSGQPFVPASGSPFTMDSKGQSFTAPSALYFDPADQLLAVGLAGNGLGPQLRALQTSPIIGSAYPSLQYYPVVLSCATSSFAGLSTIASSALGMYNGTTFVNYGNASAGGILGFRDVVFSATNYCANIVSFSTPASTLTVASGITVDPFNNVFVTDAKTNHINMYYAGVGGPPICQY